MITENINYIAEAALGRCFKGIEFDFNSEAQYDDSWVIRSSSLKELLKTPLNFCFRSAVIKYPSFILTHGEVSGIIQMVQENSLPNGKVMTVAQNTDDGDCNITIFGIGRFIYDQTGFSFTEDMPSPIEAEFRKRFMKICNLLGKDYTVYQFEESNLLLTSAWSYESWLDVLDRCIDEPCPYQNWKQLRTEIREARRLIDGKFNLHAMIAKETAKQE